MAQTTPHKIGIVCYPTYGGSGVLATELGIALSKKGHQIHFITYNQPVRLNFLSDNVYFHRVHIEDYPLFKYPPYELALATKMVEVVCKYGLEILHVHYAIPHAYAACMAKKMLADDGIKIKIVTTLHGTDINLIGNHPSYKKAVAYSIKNSDAITAVSKSLKKETVSFFDIKGCHIDVIYNFITTKYDLIKRECNKALIATSGEKIITHISNFRPVKRVHDVLSIFERIVKKIPAKLLLVGEGPLIEQIRERAKKLNIYEQIIFFGNTNEMSKILCCSDLFLLPSEAESFGLVALEAMAAGTPVISTNVGGLPEVNINGKTGFLSPLGAVEEMAENALKILNDPLFWKKFSEAAIHQSKKFKAADIVAQYEKVYETVLQ